MCQYKCNRIEVNLYFICLRLTRDVTMATEPQMLTVKIVITEKNVQGDFVERTSKYLRSGK